MKRAVYLLILALMLGSTFAISADRSKTPEALASDWREMAALNDNLATKYGDHVDMFDEHEQNVINSHGLLGANLIDSAKAAIIACYQLSQGDYCDEAERELKIAKHEMDEVQDLIKKIDEKNL